VQIQAGKYKGQKIRQVDTLAIRPCSSRVKKSLFDTIGARVDFEGLDVLDLFAGFGSLGFEALSRGARSACFVDLNRDALAAIRATAAQLGVLERVRIVNSDVMTFLKREEKRFDLVFCDPPYSCEEYTALIERVAGGDKLEEEGMMVMEHHARIGFEQSPWYWFHKDYGMTRVSFFTLESPSL
jgi:16S rRNA (guanine(966)-N(2))-methyltransferase RsmD